MRVQFFCSHPSNSGETVTFSPGERPGYVSLEAEGVDNEGDGAYINILLDSVDVGRLIEFLQEQVK